MAVDEKTLFLFFLKLNFIVRLEGKGRRRMEI